MDCRESHELMSGAVDNELTGEEAAEFYEHIEICGSCKDEFELEKMTKAFLKRKITYVDVPVDLKDAIVSQVSSYGTVELRSGFFSRLFGNNFLQPALAVAFVLVLAVVMIFMNRDNIIMPSRSVESLNAVQSEKVKDALTLAEDNFRNVLSGKFKPQITAIGTSDVAEFLRRNTGYVIVVPAVHNAEWIGGSVSTYNGIKIAHVVYKMGEEYIYLYSFPKQSAQSNKISLPPACKDKVHHKEWFWGIDSDGDTQAVWCSGDHIYIATTNLGRESLISYLQPREETSP